MILDAATQIPRPDKGHPYRLGVPWRWVLHTVECDPDTDLTNAARTHPTPPHFWAAPARRQLIQSIDTDLAAQALAHPPGAVETNHARAIQVEIAGYASSSHTWPGEWIDWLRDVLIIPIARHHHIRIHHHPDFHGAGNIRFRPAAWLTFDGICGHTHVPVNDHTDPGAIDIDRLTTRQETDDMFSDRDRDALTEILTKTRRQGVTLGRILTLLGAVDDAVAELSTDIREAGTAAGLSDGDIERLLNALAQRLAA